MSAGPPAGLHHGRYEPEGRLKSGLVLLVLHLALCSLPVVVWPRMLGITDGMDQKGFIKFVDIPFVAQRQFPMVQTVRRTIDIHQLLNTVADVPVVRSCRFSRAGGG